MSSYAWLIRGREIPIRWPLVMGIVNVTPDSFSDGGRFFDASAAIDHAMRLVGDGADILDIGGESTRPGAEPVSLADELGRIVPIVAAIAKRVDVPISIDTMKSEVARAALDVGASIVNDVTGLSDPAMRDLVAESRAGAVVMHMQGTPQTMQLAPTYPEGVVAAIDRFFELRLHDCAMSGIAAEQVVLDPGVGFGKTGPQCWELIARLGEFGRLNRPICLGVSRKGFIGKVTNRTPTDSLAGSLAVACHALANRSVHILRVHDVAATRDAVKVIERIHDIER
ncbi:MAG: dihydropteroate synthase [Gemmataceae bacterium]